MNIQKLFCRHSGPLAFITGEHFRLYFSGGGKSSNTTATTTTTTTTNRQLANNADGIINNTSDIGNNNKDSKVNFGGTMFDFSGIVNKTGAGGGGIELTVNNSDREVSLAAIEAAKSFNSANNAALDRTVSAISAQAKDNLAAASQVASSQEQFVAQASGNKVAYYIAGGLVILGGLFILSNRKKAA